MRIIENLIMNSRMIFQEELGIIIPDLISLPANQIKINLDNCNSSYHCFCPGYQCHTRFYSFQDASSLRRNTNLYKNGKKKRPKKEIIEINIPSKKSNRYYKRHSKKRPISLARL